MTLEQARGQFSPDRVDSQSKGGKGASHGEWSVQWADGYRVPDQDAVACWSTHRCVTVPYEITSGTTKVPGIDTSSLVESGQRIPTHAYLKAVNPIGFTVVIVDNEEKLPKPFRAGKITRLVYGNNDVLMVELGPEQPIIQPTLRFTAAGDGRFGVSLKALPAPEEK